MSTKGIIHLGLVSLALMFYAIAPKALGSVSVVIQPQLQHFGVGGSATFTAQTTVTAGETIEGYVWSFSANDLPPFNVIPNATSPTLTINDAQLTNAGYYVVSVSYESGNLSGGTVKSTAAQLTEVTGPIITSPVSASSQEGFPFNYTITATGSAPITFGASGLPPGLTVNAATGVISGIPGAFGNFSVTLYATNLVTGAASLALTVTSDVPGITSPLTTNGQQGSPFTYTITASNNPVTFGASGLPTGINLDPATGIISGVSALSGIFPVTISAANQWGSNTETLTLNLASAIPVITSPLTLNGQQGAVFNYNILASNNPLAFTASGLPPGVELNPNTGLLFGSSLVSGTFVVTITAGNQWGADTETLTLNLTTDVPGITSALTAAGVENQPFFSYAITASNSPTSFDAVGLPAGLLLNPKTGLITGALLFGGTNDIQISAANAYGVATSTLRLSVAYAKLPGLAIINVTNIYSSPYLLDFTFSLRDNPGAVNDPSLGNAVVRDPSELQVQCFEGDLQDSNAVPIPSETAFIVNKAIDTKQFKTFFALDYSYSMFATSNAIPDMQDAVESLIDEQPPSAQFGVVEFSADYLAPQLVTGFTADKSLLTADIEGIQTNFVKNNYAGTRMYDAVALALTNFNKTNINVENYIILMSDGYDDSSTLAVTTNFPTPVDVLVSMANSNAVKIYCVGFGLDPNTNVLQALSGETGGRYYAAATPADVAAQFAQLLKDLDSEYLLRWATLQRSSIGFQPMFTVTVDGRTADFNTNFDLIVSGMTVDTNTMPATTNFTYTNISDVPFYVPSAWAGNVQVGALSLAADANTNISTVTLSATYVPRFTRELRLHYRANYPCEPNLLETGPGEILSGWSLTQTNDGGGGSWLTLASPNPTNALDSLPYGAMSDLIAFQFPYQAVPQQKLAFSFMTVDTNIYTNMPPSPQGFTLSNSIAFTTNYPAPPPLGTPTPWLELYGFTNTNDFAADELSSPNNNGFALWQDYIAGLNPLQANSTFAVTETLPSQPGQPPLITFNTALGRVYRVDTASSIGDWTTLLDNIPGTGGPVTIPDNRDLSGASAIFYRAVVRY